MSGRRLMIALLAFVAVFAAALVWFQFFAYYSRHRGDADLAVGTATIRLRDLDQIDATSSPLKLLACFVADAGAFDDLPAAADPTPLVAPPWFGCFDAGQITADLAAGRATAHLAAGDNPSGFDLIVATYPDGRGFMWRQLNDRFAE
ncbi:MAG TPA: DUF6446 family protein [Amaricoccus sp.]|nr:DUF6446 family protein [Amaricoccus sp.]